MTFRLHQEAHKGVIPDMFLTAACASKLVPEAVYMTGYRVDHEQGGYVRWLNSWIVQWLQIRWISLELAFLWRTNKAQRETADLNLISWEYPKQYCFVEIN